MQKQKRILVLDLDETIIYQQERDIEGLDVDFTVEAMGKTLEIIKRPGLDIFLKCIREYYDIVIWTAGCHEYAEKVVGKLFPGENIPFLDRDHCQEYVIAKLQVNIKNLSKIEGFDPKTTIIVDDKEFSFAFQPNNGVVIPSFKGQPEDKMLAYLFVFLWAVQRNDFFMDPRDWLYFAKMTFYCFKDVLYREIPPALSCELTFLLSKIQIQ